MSNYIKAMDVNNEPIVKFEFKNEKTKNLTKYGSRNV